MDVTIKMAYDDEFVYSLFTVVDDYDYSPDDPHSLGFAVVACSPSTRAVHTWVQTTSWVRTTDRYGRHLALGTRMSWRRSRRWIGSTLQGDGKDPGNDSLHATIDDEWAIDAETREDDNGRGCREQPARHVDAHQPDLTA